eukprot:758461-Hanusia_phi.AAC.2
MTGMFLQVDSGAFSCSSSTSTVQAASHSEVCPCHHHVQVLTILWQDLLHSNENVVLPTNNHAAKVGAAAVVSVLLARMVQVERDEPRDWALWTETGIWSTSHQESAPAMGSKETRSEAERLPADLQERSTVGGDFMYWKERCRSPWVEQRQGKWAWSSAGLSDAATNIQAALNSSARGPRGSLLPKISGASTLSVLIQKENQQKSAAGDARRHEGLSEHSSRATRDEDVERLPRPPVPEDVRAEKLASPHTPAADGTAKSPRGVDISWVEALLDEDGRCSNRCTHNLDCHLQSRWGPWKPSMNISSMFAIKGRRGTKDAQNTTQMETGMTQREVEQDEWLDLWSSSSSQFTLMQTEGLVKINDGVGFEDEESSVA